MTRDWAGLRGALMVCGTASDVGKSQIVTGLCRLLARNGVRVAPFKAQNLSNNSWVTAAGHEIGRAQGIQAIAAGVDAEAAMNPVLLKFGAGSAQVMLDGVSAGHLRADEYAAMQAKLFEHVVASLRDLRARFDVVICEGSGSPAEINLLDRDIANLRVAHATSTPAIVVGDISRGGVFAALHGTVALLPAHLRGCVRGFVINKLLGDPSLLGDGPAQLAVHCGVPTLGVVPWIEGLTLDAEDSTSLGGSGGEEAGVGASAGAGALDIAVIRLPHLSNFTDFDALGIEAGVHVRYVAHPGALGRPDLIVVPGSKATVSDLAWLRSTGFMSALTNSDAPVLGICAGYQMLGAQIDDAVESGARRVDGFGWLPVATAFHEDKVTARRRATAFAARVDGYQIHHGRVTPLGTGHDSEAWMRLDDGTEELAAWRDGRWVGGTSLHGLFDADGFRAAFLQQLARWRAKTFEPTGRSFAAHREAQIDRLADAIEAHVDVDALTDLIAAAGAAAVEDV